MDTNSALQFFLITCTTSLAFDSFVFLASRKYGDYTQPYPVASSYHYDPLPPPPTFSSPTDPTHPHPSPSLQVRPKNYPNKKPIGTIAALDRGACVRSPWFDPGPPCLLLLLPSSISTTCKRHQGGPGGDAGAYQVVAKVMRAIGIIQFNWTNISQPGMQVDISRVARVML